MSTKANNKANNNALEIKTTFKVVAGIVIGKDAKGRLGDKIREFKADTMKDLEDQIVTAYDKKTLDLGLRFQEYVCTVYQVEETSTVEIDGKEYVYKNTTEKHYGDVEFAKSLLKDTAMKMEGIAMRYANL